nr:aldo/keto reductase [Carnobacterium viridans]
MYGYVSGIRFFDGINVIRAAYELGVNFFDTDEVYGDNEQLVGKAVKAFRDEIVLATKFGFDMDSNTPGSGFNSYPDNIRKVAENSLLRLSTDHIDLFYQHIPDPNIPIEEVAGVVGELIKEGKVKYFGLSNSGSDSIRRTQSNSRFSTTE